MTTDSPLNFHLHQWNLVAIFSTVPEVGIGTPLSESVLRSIFEYIWSVDFGAHTGRKPCWMDSVLFHTLQKTFSGNVDCSPTFADLSVTIDYGRSY